jgi:hypothetical protein
MLGMEMQAINAQQHHNRYHDSDDNVVTEEIEEEDFEYRNDSDSEVRRES